jgi:hypothetical protein
MGLILRLRGKHPCTVAIVSTPAGRRYAERLAACVASSDRECLLNPAAGEIGSIELLVIVATPQATAHDAIRRAVMHSYDHQRSMIVLNVSEELTDEGQTCGLGRHSCRNQPD